MIYNSKKEEQFIFDTFKLESKKLKCGRRKISLQCHGVKNPPKFV